MMIFGREAENLPTMPFLLEIQDAPDNILRILPAGDARSGRGL